MRRSIGGLMDESDPLIDTTIREILDRETARWSIQYHGLRHRNAGNKLLIEFHLLFPENVLLSLAHERATQIEREIHKALPQMTEVITHLEPMEDHDEVHEKLLKGNPS